MGHETLIRCTIASSLAWDENVEKQIDRVTAIAFASRRNELGAAMLRVEALDAQAMRKVVLLVVRRLNHKHHITRGFAERMVMAVLQEILQPGCTTCCGKGEIHREAETVTVCQNCGGTGLHRFADRDRLAMVGGTFNREAYDYALCLIRDSLKNILNSANNRLTG